MLVRALIVALLACALPLATSAAPEAEPWPRWDASRDNKLTINHAQWDAFLRRYVSADSDGYSRLAYAEVRPVDKAALDEYLKRLQAIRITEYSRPEQRAYWTNLYNAALVRLILDHYPVESVLKIDISPGFFTKGPWGKKLLEVEGERLSLNDIAHRILRPIWKDELTHYGLHCAALGCPNLPQRAYTGASIEEMLKENAREFVNHPRGVRIENARLKASSLYVWYQDDFGGKDENVIAHLRRYAEPELARQLGEMTGINGHFFDWTLNGTRGTTPATGKEASH